MAVAPSEEPRQPELLTQAFNAAFTLRRKAISRFRVASLGHNSFLKPWPQNCMKLRLSFHYFGEPHHATR